MNLKEFIEARDLIFLRNEIISNRDDTFCVNEHIIFSFEKDNDITIYVDVCGKMAANYHITDFSYDENEDSIYLSNSGIYIGMINL